MPVPSCPAEYGITVDSAIIGMKVFSWAQWCIGLPSIPAPETQGQRVKGHPQLHETPLQETKQTNPEKAASELVQQVKVLVM